MTGRYCLSSMDGDPVSFGTIQSQVPWTNWLQVLLFDSAVAVEMVNLSLVLESSCT